MARSDLGQSLDAAQSPKLEPPTPRALERARVLRALATDLEAPTLVGVGDQDGQARLVTACDFLVNGSDAELDAREVRYLQRLGAF